MMENVQKEHWYFMVLLICVSIFNVSVQQSNSVASIRLEEGMVLPCACPWTGNLSIVSWTKLIRFDKSPVAVYHPEYGVHISPPYQTRIQFLKATPTDGSIKVSNVSQDDAGLYLCSVQMFPHGSWTTNIKVENVSGTEEDNTAVGEESDIPISGADPELIEADTVLTAERGENLTISCVHQHNGSVHQVTLEKLDYGSAAGLMLFKCQMKDGDLFEDSYTERGMVKCSHQLDASLQLNGLTEEDGGLYRCRFSTDAGELTTSVRQNVPRQVTSVYLLYITGAVGVVLLLSILLVLVLCQRRRKIKMHGPKQHPVKRRFGNEYENVPVSDKMRKGTNQRDPVYANIHTVCPHAKRKR